MSTLPFSVWLATEGGRKCPQCGRYARPDELGDLSFSYRTQNGGTARVSMFGHKPGHGCNAAEKARPRGQEQHA